MSRANLLQLLPDLGEQPAPPPAGRKSSVFEPLVVRASRVDQFEELGPVAEDPFAPTQPGAHEDFAQASFEPNVDSALHLDLDGTEPGGLPDFETIPPAAGPLDFTDATEAGQASLAPFNDDPFANEAASAPETTGPGGDVAAPFSAVDAEAHRQDVERLELAHREAVGTLVAEAIPRMKADVVAELSAQLAPVLAKHLKAKTVTATVEALAGEIRTILADKQATSFELRGPEDLLAAFDEQWDSKEAKVSKVTADTPDLFARIDKHIVATRLGELDRMIGEALS